MARGARLAPVVSPYLSVLPAHLWAYAYSGIADASCRRMLASARRTHRLLFDHLSATIVAVSGEDFATLAEMREHPNAARRMDSPGREPARRRLAALGLLLDECTVWRRHRYDQINIEINSHCNFRCTFCPVASDPLPRKLMPPELIREVMDRISEYGVPSIALNHYGEPTLSPHLVTSVRLARERGLRVLLFTNASHLGPETVRDLAACGNVTVLANLPTTDPGEFQRLTRTTLQDRVIGNVRGAVRAGLPVWLSINTPASMTARQRRRLRAELVRRTGAHAYVSRMISRAGSMTNQAYATAPTHGRRLAGCLQYLQALTVSVEGKVIMCCNDYRQENVLGDLRESTLEEIVNGARAVQVRRYIFGGAEAPEGLICRRCEETRPADANVWVGSLADWPSPASGAAGIRTSLGMRRLLGRFPLRLDEHTLVNPRPGRAGLSVAGLRFR